MSGPITRGDRLLVTTAGGETVPVRALTGQEPGDRFPVVWVATEADWQTAEELGEKPHGIPWPIEAIQIVSAASATTVGSFLAGNA